MLTKGLIPNPLGSLIGPTSTKSNIFIDCNNNCTVIITIGVVSSEPDSKKQTKNCDTIRY